jgi:hypothetical protein
MELLRKDKVYSKGNFLISSNIHKWFINESKLLLSLFLCWFMIKYLYIYRGEKIWLQIKRAHHKD